MTKISGSESKWLGSTVGDSSLRADGPRYFPNVICLTSLPVRRWLARNGGAMLLAKDEKLMVRATNLFAAASVALLVSSLVLSNFFREGRQHVCKLARLSYGIHHRLSGTVLTIKTTSGIPSLLKA